MYNGVKNFCVPTLHLQKGFHLIMTASADFESVKKNIDAQFEK